MIEMAKRKATDAGTTTTPERERAPMPGSQPGLVLGAQEAGLREAYRRIHAARLAGILPVRTYAAAEDGGPAQFRPRTPVPQVVRGVGVIDVVGPLSKAEDLYNWFFGSLTYGQLVEQVEQVRRDVRVQAVLLRIDSPGGTVAGVSDLCQALNRLRDEKPLVAAVSDLGASCAYQVAACAPRIFADRDGWVGSVGVYCIIDEVSRMFEDAGWAVRLFATERDPYKGMGTPGTPVTTEHAEEYQRVVDELGTEMIRSIYAARPALRTAAQPLPDGRCYMGEDARQRGLIDGVATWYDVLEAMADGDLTAENVGQTP